MDKITLAHGAGGREMHKLIDGVFMKAFPSSALRQKRDSAILRIVQKKIAFTTDSYVVDPIFFPGGDIGSLAVYGTVNDLSVCGARAGYISVAAVIEEGFPVSSLNRIVASIGRAAKAAGVEIVTGDTKVVAKGNCDGIYINTSGIGEVYRDGLSVKNVRPGDAVIVTGPIGDHAISVLSKREGIAFDTSVKSDSAPLGRLIERALGATKKMRVMRDPTRGGLATTLNEIAEESRREIVIEESDVPVRGGVREACELLGYDPLYLACEGRAVMVMANEDAARVLRVIRSSAGGRQARIVGRVGDGRSGRVYMKTLSGGRRIVDMLSGEQLPRIC